MHEKLKRLRYCLSVLEQKKDGLAEKTTSVLHFLSITQKYSRRSLLMEADNQSWQRRTRHHVRKHASRPHRNLTTPSLQCNVNFYGHVLLADDVIPIQHLSSILLARRNRSRRRFARSVCLAI